MAQMLESVMGRMLVQPMECVLVLELETATGKMWV